MTNSEIEYHILSNNKHVEKVLQEIMAENEPISALLTDRRLREIELSKLRKKKILGITESDSNTEKTTLDYGIPRNKKPLYIQ